MRESDESKRLDAAIAAAEAEKEILLGRLKEETATIRISLAEAQMRRDAEIGQFHNTAVTAAALRRMRSVVSLARRLMRGGKENGSPAEEMVFNMFLLGHSLGSIAEAVDLPEDEVSRIIEDESAALYALEDTFRKALDVVNQAGIIERRLSELEKEVGSIAAGTPPEWADMKIKDLGLSARTRNAILYFNMEHPGREILTLGDFTKRTRRDVVRIRNLGKKSIEEIEALLHKHGLDFKDNNNNNQ